MKKFFCGFLFLFSISADAKFDFITADPKLPSYNAVIDAFKNSFKIK